MANPSPSNNIAAIGVNTRFTPQTAGQQPSYRRAAFAEALEIQGLILSRLRDEKTDTDSIASLARAWSVVEETKRVLRGIPNPGQLRPETLILCSWRVR